MRFRVFCFPGRARHRELNKLKDFLSKSGFAEDDRNPEFVFIVGGDGSFFHFAKQYAHKKVKIVGVPSGNTAFSMDRRMEKPGNLLSEHWKNIELIKIEIGDRVLYAINDFYLSGDLMMEAVISIDDVKWKRFRGSGLLFSTQHGSTGMNKSFGGPIILPGNDLWMFREMGTRDKSGLNNSVILAKTNTITVKIVGKEEYRSYVDGQWTQEKLGKIFKISMVKGDAEVLRDNIGEYVKRMKKIWN